MTRAALGWTVAELVKRSGLSANTIRSVEQGNGAQTDTINQIINTLRDIPSVTLSEDHGKRPSLSVRFFYNDPSNVVVGESRFRAYKKVRTKKSKKNVNPEVGGSLDDPVDSEAWEENSDRDRAAEKAAQRQEQEKLRDKRVKPRLEG
jgi:transcriptional regulator with XRE-family HTH domain